MPLIICAVFFIVLFSCEGLWHLTQIEYDQNALRRYNEVEHRRRHTGDEYIDFL